MNKQEKIQSLRDQYSIVDLIDLSEMITIPIYQQKNLLTEKLEKIYRSEYAESERILFVFDRYDKNLLITLQQVLNRVDISNYFCIFLFPGEFLVKNALDDLKSVSTDPIDIVVDWFVPSGKGSIYSNPAPTKLDVSELNLQEKKLLYESKTFCIYPWIHLHAYPTGEAWPCCHAEMSAGSVGNAKTHSLERIWNSDRMKELRSNMLTEKSDRLCVRCYEQEDAGFLSGRKSANGHHGHHISRVSETQPDGHLDRFEMTYWDVRFSNLCNLSCRSCGHIFSSSWYQDQVKLAGPDWAKKNKPLNIAGRDPDDMWNQLLSHIDFVEQIYFAGGEPLMMDEHYRILEELERRGRFDVRLTYNTNFTQTKLKDRTVFDYWKKFKNVSVGASLDAMGPRAEYIRKGTDWAVVEENRIKMMEICPDVDFYISSTLSIMNAWHLPDFHKNWTDRGLIRAQDFNVNILQDPPHYRMDIAPMKYKQRLRIKYEEHLEWLRPQDHLNRASQGFASAINFMMNIDNTGLIEKFWKKSHQLDQIRDENILIVLPELGALVADSA